MCRALRGGCGLPRYAWRILGELCGPLDGGAAPSGGRDLDPRGRGISTALRSRSTENVHLGLHLTFCSLLLLLLLSLLLTLVVVVVVVAVLRLSEAHECTHAALPVSPRCVDVTGIHIRPRRAPDEEQLWSGHAIDAAKPAVDGTCLVTTSPERYARWPGPAAAPGVRGQWLPMQRLPRQKARGSRIGCPDGEWARVPRRPKCAHFPGVSGKPGSHVVCGAGNTEQDAQNGTRGHDAVRRQPKDLGSSGLINGVFRPLRSNMRLPLKRRFATFFYCS